MTSSTISLRGITGSGFTYPAPKAQEAGGNADFSQILDNAASKDSVQEYEKNTSRVETDTTPDVQENEKIDASSTKDDAKGVTDSQKPDNVDVSEDDMEEAMEVISTSVQEIQKMLCEKLNLTQEELMQALEGLGMDELDMLDLGNATKLLLYLEGQNEMALLTNEELYGMAQDLEGAMQGLADELMSSLDAISGDGESLFSHALKNMNQSEGVTVQVSGEQVAALEKKESSENAGQDNQANANLLGNQNLNNLQQVAENMNAQSAEAMADLEQTRMIMDQIMEHMNLRLDAEETTLEMHLHPEELGNLHVTISAKEGVMTAQFTAESEAVKAVLENQIMQLQSKFDEQNVKVEAIEISVATKGFEQNLEQDNSNNASYQEEEKKQRVRKIDLGSFDAVEELPEEDQVVAEMMQLQGNRLDYMA